VVVSMLSVSDRTDTPLDEIGGDVDQVPQRAAQPVQPPHHQRVARAQRGCLARRKFGEADAV
jgi:hypothetical protein